MRRQIARLAADSARVLLTTHARQRMSQRRVTLPQVLEVLREGAVVENAHQDIRGNWKCTLERVVAGDRVKVAAAVTESKDGDRVVVITVIA